jgi:hypothetical protein
MNGDTLSRVGSWSNHHDQGHLRLNPSRDIMIPGIRMIPPIWARKPWSRALIYKPTATSTLLRDPILHVRIRSDDYGTHLISIVQQSIYHVWAPPHLRWKRATEQSSRGAALAGERWRCGSVRQILWQPVLRDTEVTARWVRSPYREWSSSKDSPWHEAPPPTQSSIVDKSTMIRSPIHHRRPGTWSTTGVAIPRWST